MVDINIKLFQTAIGEFGVREKAGKDDNNYRIVNYFKEVGYPEIKNDETAWCAAYVSWVLKENNVQVNLIKAYDFIKIGQHVSKPKVGDIVVFKNHVGFYVSHHNGIVNVLGGNQSNKVKISRFSTDKVEDIRRIMVTEDFAQRITDNAIVPSESFDNQKNGIIKRFLIEKAKGHPNIADNDGFEQYPIQIIVNGNLIDGWLNDAVETVDDCSYKLELIVLNKNRKEFHTITKECQAPEGCVVDWDLVHCASF